MNGNQCGIQSRRRKRRTGLLIRNNTWVTTIISGKKIREHLNVAGLDRETISHLIDLWIEKKNTLLLDIAMQFL